MCCLLSLTLFVALYLLGAGNEYHYRITYAYCYVHFIASMYCFIFIKATRYDCKKSSHSVTRQRTSSYSICELFLKILTSWWSNYEVILIERESSKSQRFISTCSIRNSTLVDYYHPTQLAYLPQKPAANNLGLTLHYERTMDLSAQFCKCWHNFFSNEERVYDSLQGSYMEQIICDSHLLCTVLTFVHNSNLSGSTLFLHVTSVV